MSGKRDPPSEPSSFQISMLPEPSDRFGDGFAVWPRPIAKFAFRLGRGEEHAVLGEAEPRDRHEWLAVGEKSERLRGISDRKYQPAREPQLWRRAAGKARDF